MATQTITETAIELQDLTIHANASPSDKTGRTIISSPPKQLPPEYETPISPPKLSKSRAITIITQLVAVNFITNFSGGLITIGLPTIALDLHLPSNLLLWPNSVGPLASGSCVLIAGAVADILGSRRVNLVGCFFSAVFMLACGLPRMGIQLILFRALQGFAGALSGPTAMAMISTNVERGRLRNMGFASLFLAFPLGYSLGLVVGGALVSTIGWRWGFLGAGVIQFVLLGVSLWTLPKDRGELVSARHVLGRLKVEIDWIGAFMACASISIFSYVLATLSANPDNIRQASNIALLTISLILVPAFAIWMHFQEKRGKPALIRNSIWRSNSFTSVLLIVLISNACIKCLAQFSSLYFQKVQLLSAFQSALRFLPQALVSTIGCILSGVFVNKIPILAAVLSSTILCTIASMLMAITNPAWSYWYAIFWSQILAPLNIDIMFTVASLVVSDAFPKTTQALAGATLSTFAQLGTSIGLCVMSVISANVSNASSFEDKNSPEALLEGYRAVFWALFAWMGIACVLGYTGLRKVGKVGKED